MKNPSRPAVKSFIPAGSSDQPGPQRRPPFQPTVAKRPPEVNEQILDAVTAKLEALTAYLDRSFADLATKKDVADLAKENRATRKLLQQHMREAAEDRVLAKTRHEGIMGLLSDILTSLPDVVVHVTPREKVTIPPPPPEPSDASLENVPPTSRSPSGE